jgi:hypothetical protein
MLSDDNILDVIRLRDDLSVCGNDGISYRTVKAAGPQGVKFIRHIIKAMIQNCRIPESWMEAWTVLNYKKGNCKDPKNWRPITIANCIDRIYMCLMARAFQHMCSRYGIYIDMQKSFIKKTNGCSEHGIMLSGFP